MVRRRPLVASLVASLAALGIGVPRAQAARSMRDPLRLGCDAALADSGLAGALLQGFGRDTGLAVNLLPNPVLPMLDALAQGELDVAFSNAPEAEARLEQQGLAHDRRAIAAGAFVIVGPAPQRKANDPAGIAGLRDAAQAFTQLHAAGLAQPGSVRFLSANDGSGALVCEQALWRQARQAPALPWYVPADERTPVLAQARAAGAYALVERGVWLVHGGAPLAVLVEADVRLAEAVHVLRSFRSGHPAAALFVSWIAGPKGRRIVAAQRAYRAP
ncbi:MAG TPA: substrate-binding domain-containing protein [Burkholderiaceae bacterium]|nr:substrate-binding domain-containing protein [Burkholderiaceae bacterium]